MKLGQRYFPIVLHLAGDSTITRCFPFFGSILKVTFHTVLVVTLSTVFFVVLVGFLRVAVVFALVAGMISA